LTAEARCIPCGVAFESTVAEALRHREGDSRLLKLARFRDALVSKADGNTGKTLSEPRLGARSMSRMSEFSRERSKTMRLSSGVMSKVRIAAGLLK